MMIAIYCRGKHQTKKGEPCADCKALEAYALKRTLACPFMITKTFCSACKRHCYSKEKQKEIREVMRFAGPRMLFVNPRAAIAHIRIMIKVKGERGHVS